MGADDPLSTGQYIPLVLILCISSLLSLTASVAVVRIARFRLGAAYQRYLCIMSIATILNSTFLILHPFLIPNDDDYPWAFGNIQTCRMVGFFFHFGALMIAMYYTMLSIYFYCSIRTTNGKEEKQPEDIVGWSETFANIACWLIPAILAAAAAGTQSINFNAAPDMCLIYGDTTGADILSYVFAAFIIVSLLTGLGVTCIVKFTVRGTMKRSDSNNNAGGGRAGVGNDDSSSLDDETKQRLEAVAAQSVLYSAAFFNTIIWPLILAILPVTTNSIVYYIFQLLAYAMYPFHGVLNCCIYIRPRFQMLKVMYPEDSLLVLARVSLSMAGDPEEIEMVRAYIYGDDYECPSSHSGDLSHNSSLPNMVEFDPNRPLSATSLVSCPGSESGRPPSEHEDFEDDDDNDPEAGGKGKVEIQIDQDVVTAPTHSRS